MSERLKGNLKRRAAAWAGNLTKLAKSLAPNHVRPAISSTTEQKADGTYIIRITASRRVAPDARAQEYGSGLHARRGIKQKYPIRPKTRSALAFYENAKGTWNYSLGMPKAYAPDGRGLFFGVMHPGIQAANSGAGYIAPAIKELKKKAKAELTQDVRDAIVSDLRRSFGRK